MGAAERERYGSMDREATGAAPRTPLPAFLPVAFVGAGSMARALVGGLLAAGFAGPADVRVTNRSDRERLRSMAETFKVRTYRGGARGRAATLRGARVVVLATKPQDAPVALDQCREVLETLGERPLVISVAAGLSTRAVEDRLPPGTPVVRAMPNTSCQVGRSATALAGGRWAAESDLEAARLLFGSVGFVVKVPEEQMDAVTGLSGSGPAYIYLMLEAMTEAGASLGLPPDLAYRLALETLRGAVSTALLTSESPAELKRRVTSPGGTTMAGLAVLEESGFKRAVIEAVRRASERSAQLAAHGRTSGYRAEGDRPA
ncbi:MAG: pyrroline-5-carboxylate reductase [Bacillota bacterium]